MAVCEHDPAGAGQVSRVRAVRRTHPWAVIDFSDFQCPSCKRAADSFKPILEKYGDRIHSTRVDLPLIPGHPRAFAAARISRAIDRESPEVIVAFHDFAMSLHRVRVAKFDGMCPFPRFSARQSSW